MIKRIIQTATILMMVFTSNAMNNNTPTQDRAKNGNTDILIAYFSYSGNTRKLARKIQQFTAGELFEIQTVHAYPKEYEPCTELAKQEKETNARPKLKTSVDNIDQYKIIFIGCPSWWHTAPMAVLSFLESYDLSGKIIIPFLTHESREDGAFDAIKKLTPKSKHLKGFDIHGDNVENATLAVQEWLKNIGII